MRVLTLIPIVSKLLAMSFKTTLGFILCGSFPAVLGDNLDSLPWLAKFSDLLNHLNIFITDCTLDLGIV